MKRYINPPTLFPSLQHGFSQAVRSRGGTTIYISGQTAWDAQKQLVGGRNLGAPASTGSGWLAKNQAAVEAAGGVLADVVALRLYLVNYKPEDAAAVGQALREFFPGEQVPASTWVGVAALAMEDFLIEKTDGAVHVRNAPSPAATSSLALAKLICDQAT